MKRFALIFGCATIALLTSYLATSHCCERLNIFAAVGLMKPGWMGLSQYREVFMGLSLFSITSTVLLTFYGPGSCKLDIGITRTTSLSLLVGIVGLLLFVIPWVQPSSLEIWHGWS